MARCFVSETEMLMLIQDAGTRWSARTVGQPNNAPSWTHACWLAMGMANKASLAGRSLSLRPVCRPIEHLLRLIMFAYP